MTWWAPLQVYGPFLLVIMLIVGVWAISAYSTRVWMIINKIILWNPLLTSFVQYGSFESQQELKNKARFGKVREIHIFISIFNSFCFIFASDFLHITLLLYNIVISSVEYTLIILLQFDIVKFLTNTPGLDSIRSIMDNPSD